MIEPRDVALEFDRSRWSVTDHGRGRFIVTARVPQATAELRASVRGASVDATELALGVGLSDHPLADLQDAGRWTGPGAGPGKGHRAGGSPTRCPPAAGPPPRLRPGRSPYEPARSLSLQVNGDGSGAGPVVEVTDADGRVATLRGPVADWTGWREISLPLPAMAERPFAVTRISAAAAPARTALATAAREAGTGAVAVVQPYAPRVVDRKEAALRLRLLADFRRTTGERAAVITLGAPASRPAAPRALSSSRPRTPVAP
ncbi:hypothetical protein J7F03_14795 [Streptomyces sp. ISL-43]|uniref:hypothetical protein n=1 Tax=Streptomyces sp. ISL-43 TaxID=2819183 RepID=UPI001BEA0FA0|nr:hypothetical protein [Streptomyces sp. ISL-43]MBT2448325.1 hypothetical protein [Streptomyces sp. ISL-43]